MKPVLSRLPYTKKSNRPIYNSNDVIAVRNQNEAPTATFRRPKQTKWRIVTRRKLILLAFNAPLMAAFPVNTKWKMVPE